MTMIRASWAIDLLLKRQQSLTGYGCQVEFNLWDADNDVLQLEDIQDGEGFCLDGVEFAIEGYPKSCAEDIGKVVIMTNEYERRE